MNKIAIINPTIKERSIIFAVADVVGLDVYHETRSNKGITEYPNIHIDPTKKDNHVGGNCHEKDTKGYKWLSFKNFIKELFKYEKPLGLELNSSYKAVICHNSKTVKVGCQTFSFDKMVELNNLIMNK